MTLNYGTETRVQNTGLTARSYLRSGNRLFVGILPGRLGFDFGPVHVGIFVGKVVPDHLILRGLRCLLVSIIPATDIVKIKSYRVNTLKTALLTKHSKEVTVVS